MNISFNWSQENGCKNPLEDEDEFEIEIQSRKILCTFKSILFSICSSTVVYEYEAWIDGT